MLFLAVSAALAVPPFTASEATIAFPSPVSWGQIFVSAAGEPRLFTTQYDQTPHLFVPGPAGWIDTNMPPGRVVTGPDDVVVLLDPARADTARVRWDGAAFVPAPGPTLPGVNLGAVAMGANGRIAAFTYDVSQPVVVREQADGTFESSPVPQPHYAGGWAEGGELWWIDDSGLGGPWAVRQDLRGVQGFPAGGLDARGRPALTWWEPGRLWVSGSAGAASVRQPADVTARDQDCVAAACHVVGNYAQSLSVAAFAGGVAVPYVRHTVESDLRCRPYDGPFHACDPAGPINNCPPQQEWTCDTTGETRVSTLRMAWYRDGRVEDVALGEKLGWDSVPEVTIWDATADAKGSLHLLVHAPSVGVRYARLDTVAGRAAVSPTVVGAPVPGSQP